MSDYFKLSQKFKNAVLNPYWAPPEHAKVPKGCKKGEHGIWDEPVIIEDWVWEKDESTGDETIRVRVRVTGDTITDNQGKSHTEWLHFPAVALETDAPTNIQQQFSISYGNLVKAYWAAGGEGTPDPGAVDADLMRGARVQVTARLLPNRKTGDTRMNVDGWKAPE